jgi:hypothetical protein
MKRDSRSLGVVVQRGVACLALCAMVTSCGDDDDSSAASSATDTAAAATTNAATTVERTTAPTTTATIARAASGDACTDREALRSDIAALTDVDVVAEGTNGLKAAVDAVKSDLEKVKASAGSIVEPQVQAVQDAIAAAETGIEHLGQGGAAEVATALTALSTATTTLMTSLEGGPCG